jgi:hypothetical protein
LVSLTASVLVGERMSEAATRNRGPPLERETWTTPVHRSMPAARTPELGEGEGAAGGKDLVAHAPLTNQRTAHTREQLGPLADRWSINW